MSLAVAVSQGREPSRASTEQLSQVSRTLVIPLLARARASRRQLGLADPLAEQLLTRIEWTELGHEKNADALLALAARAQMIDEVGRDFFVRHPAGQLLSLGCGLCTRFHRIDNGELRGFDVDLPEVIALKASLLPQTSRYTMLARSVTDPLFVESLPLAAEVPTLVVCEGLLMYLEPEAVQRLITSLAQRLHRAELVFDYMHRYVVDAAQAFPQLVRTAAPFRWGVAHPRELEAWHPRLQFADDWSVMARCARERPRYRLLSKLPLIPRLHAVARMHVSG